MDSKRRPGLIVSPSRLHDSRKIYWIAMISSADAGERTDDILVTDPEMAGLPFKCAIRVARLAAISESLIHRRIGTITAKYRAAVTALLKMFMP